ncbi:hypothetical protein G6F70_006448 [Rhizopus microsporus]|nr:hypothetical protein G6F71_002745 [Rhizopus microsporus]KAG1197639.1 hypothetical protein G6F70_006448 [Rhizopus microsporus]KAG1213177.1 hypothetical protein G6F69_003065 [Rhizopus microsporus]KAG1234600.1 hypothetical protein G6F67_003386 [Rhizopus microsporus]KAG1263103.1 hypothetical protein G6F68_005412 [Rhizopus microsporus]
MNFTSTISGNKALATKAEPSQASRSAARDADLRRRLLQKQHQVAQRQQQQQQQQPQDTAPPPSANTNRKLDPLEIQHKKKLFQKFKFFLYKIDPDLESKIARKILLLGATREAFFSSKCTHVITTSKFIPAKKDAASTDTTSTSDPKDSMDPTIQNAQKLGLSIWSVEGALKIINILMESSTASAKAHERASIDTNGRDKKPTFVPFTGYYILVEDATNVHCPVLIKEYTKETFGEKPKVIPWPTLRKKRTKAQADAKQNREQPEATEKNNDKNEKQKETAAERNKNNENKQSSKHDDDQKTDKKNDHADSTNREADKEVDSHNHTDAKLNKPNDDTHTEKKKPIDNSDAINAKSKNSLDNNDKKTDNEKDEYKYIQVESKQESRISASKPELTNQDKESVCPKRSRDDAATADTSNIDKTKGKAITDQEETQKQALKRKRDSAQEDASPATNNDLNQTAKEDTQEAKRQRCNNDDNNKPNVNKEKEADNVKKSKEHQEQNQKGEKRKRDVDLQYCENCNERFSILTEHIKAPKHLAFIKNVDNFAELDRVLKKLLV